MNLAPAATRDRRVTFSEGKQLWAAALDALSVRIRRSIYDTWIRSLEFVSLNEGELILGSVNSYCRDIVNDQYLGVINSAFEDACGRPVQAQVVLVAQDEDGLKVLESGTEAGTEVGTAGDNDDSPECSPEPDGTDDETFYLDVLHNSVKNALLEPEKIARLPVYMLRWLPYQIGGASMLVYVALLQLAYLNRSRPSNGLAAVSATAKEITRWSGVSRMTLHRLTQPGGLFNWLGEKEAEHQYGPSEGERSFKRLPSVYRLYYLPITPGDAADIQAFLVANHAATDPRGALQLALEKQPREILHYPYRPAGDEVLKNLSPTRYTIRGILTEITGAPVSAELGALCDRLYDRLVAPDKFLAVSWYFLTHWLPKLGDEAAMFVLLSRSLCYYNEDEGSYRDEIWFERGYEEMADRLGLDSKRTIQNWFPTDPESKKRNPHPTGESARIMAYHAQMQGYMQLFLNQRPVNGAKHKKAQKLQVQRMDPLIPEHETAYDALNHLLHLLISDGRLAEFYELARRVKSVYDDTYQAEESVYNDTNDQAGHEADVFTMIQRDWLAVYNDTNGRAISVYIDTLKAGKAVYFDTFLKILRSVKDTQRTKDTSQPDTGSRPALTQKLADLERVGVIKNDSWNREGLFSAIRSESTRAELLASGATVNAFLSWLLYGSMQANIGDPVSVAIFHLRQSPARGAGGAYDRLASLAAADLVGNIFSSLHERYSSSLTADPDWQQVSRSMDREKIHRLADILQMG